MKTAPLLRVVVVLLASIVVVGLAIAPAITVFVASLAVMAGCFIATAAAQCPPCGRQDNDDGDSYERQDDGPACR